MDVLENDLFLWILEPGLGEDIEASEDGVLDDSGETGLDLFDDLLELGPVLGLYLWLEGNAEDDYFFNVAEGGGVVVGHYLHGAELVDVATTLAGGQLGKGTLDLHELNIRAEMCSALIVASGI